MEKTTATRGFTPEESQRAEALAKTFSDRFNDRAYLGSEEDLGARMYAKWIDSNGFIIFMVEQFGLTANLGRFTRRISTRSSTRQRLTGWRLRCDCLSWSDGDW